jgi:hypothetical protein
MVVAMVCLARTALGRLISAPSAPHGQGPWIALPPNLLFGAINLAFLLQWRVRKRAAATLLASSQVLLFADKLSSNV